jgi:hypothetical protein
MPGEGTELEISFRPGRESEVGALEVVLPPHLRAVSPLARNAGDGIAVLEFIAVAEGVGEIQLVMEGRPVGSKQVVAGAKPTRMMQPERVTGFLESWLWPAEPTLPRESPIDSIRFDYPTRDLGVLPGGPAGVLLSFFLASILFGVAVLKPLNIQI